MLAVRIGSPLASPGKGSPFTPGKKSRLKAAREVQDAPSSILAAHRGEQLSTIKFRDVESLLERSMSLPVGVTVSELKVAACSLFGYTVDRSADVTLASPDEGIQTFDQKEDSALTVLASEATWTEVT